MGISANDLCQHVIRPTLDYLSCHSPAAEALLLGAAALPVGAGERPRRPPWPRPVPDRQRTPPAALGPVPGAGPGARQPGPRPGQPACLPRRAAPGTDGEPALQHGHRLVVGGSRATAAARPARPPRPGSRVAPGIPAARSPARVHRRLATLHRQPQPGRLTANGKIPRPKQTNRSENFLHTDTNGCATFASLAPEPTALFRTLRNFGTLAPVWESW